MTDQEKENYEPIQSYTGQGYTALNIYLPGKFMPDAQDWAVLVGGCGVGHRNSVEEARVLLLKEAKRYCQRQITEAQRILVHYSNQLEKLERDGLTVPA